MSTLVQETKSSHSPVEEEDSTTDSCVISGDSAARLPRKLSRLDLIQLPCEYIQTLVDMDTHRLGPW
jgi:hypothetical protein